MPLLMLSLPKTLGTKVVGNRCAAKRVDGKQPALVALGVIGFAFYRYGLGWYGQIGVVVSRMQHRNRPKLPNGPG